MRVLAFCALGLCLPATVLLAGAPARIVLVQPFQNTGTKEYSWLSAALTEAVIADLYRVDGVQVISNQDRQKARRELAFTHTGQTTTALELGRLLGANLICTGSYTVVKGKVRVIARLVSVETGRTLYSGKIDGELDKLFELQDRIVVSLLTQSEKLRLPPPARPAPPAVATSPPAPTRPSASTPGSSGGHPHRPSPGTTAPVPPVAGSKPARPARPSRPAPGRRPHPDAYRWYAKGLEVQYTAPALAMLYFDNALDIEPNYRDALVQAGFTLGNEMHKYAEAEKYLDRAEVAFRGADRRTMEYARYLRLCGAVYHNRRSYARGLDYSLRAKRLMEELGHARTADYAYVLNNIGNAYYRRRILPQAVKFFRKSQSLQESAGLGRTYKYAILMNNMGAVHNAAGAARDALFYFRRARDILEEQGLRRSAFGALVLENLGRLYRDHGDGGKALALFRDAREIRTHLKTAGSRRR